MEASVDRIGEQLQRLPKPSHILIVVISAAGAGGRCGRWHAVALQGSLGLYLGRRTATHEEKPPESHHGLAATLATLSLALL